MILRRNLFVVFPFMSWFTPIFPQCPKSRARRNRSDARILVTSLSQAMTKASIHKWNDSKTYNKYGNFHYQHTLSYIYFLQINTTMLTQPVWQTLSHLIVLVTLFHTTYCQYHQVTYQILSQGQQLKIPLQEFFKNAERASIIKNKCSDGYQDVFDVMPPESPIININEQKMEVMTETQTVKLSEHLNYYGAKSVYNQPVKIFLLDNNFLMMYIYKQHCSDLQKSNPLNTSGDVVGLNLTYQILNRQWQISGRSSSQTLTQTSSQQPTPSDSYQKLGTNQTINCTSMQTLTTANQDLLYINCKDTKTTKITTTTTFLLIQINLKHDSKSYIVGMQVTHVFLLKPSDTKYQKIMMNCSEYGLKYFERLSVIEDRYANRTDNVSNIPDRIIGYCKDRSNNTLNYYLYTPKDIEIQYFISYNLSQCLAGASYISPTNASNSGFLSIIDGKVYEYYSMQSSKTYFTCSYTKISNIQYIFATSRVYADIQFHYFFLKNHSIIIKSPYKTNYQKIQVGSFGFSFTSYALSQHFMAVTMSNTTNSEIFVFDMDQLYPKPIDHKVFDKLIISSGNYLEKGFYFLTFDVKTNVMGLAEYTGYKLHIKPTNSLSGYPQKNIQLSQSKIWFIVMQTYGDFLIMQQQLNISLILRNFTDASVIFDPQLDIKVYSTYLDLNLTELAIGPLQRYYYHSSSSSYDTLTSSSDDTSSSSDDTLTSSDYTLSSFLDDSSTKKHIKFFSINYFNTIDMQQRIKIKYVAKNGSQLSLNLVYMCLNNEGKASTPYLTLFYQKIIQNCFIQPKKNYKHSYKNPNIPDKSPNFILQCSPQDNIQFKSSITSGQTSIIVLTKDKWLQYNQTYMQMCGIVAETAQCISLNYVLPKENLTITKLKLVRFQDRTNGYNYIQVFILYEKQLHYGYFIRQTTKKNPDFIYRSTFSITYQQISALQSMNLKNIHYDRNYDKFLLLHLQKKQADGRYTHKALLYDRPMQSNGDKFIGHLIQQFEEDTIESILTVDDLLIIVNWNNTHQGEHLIVEYKVTDYYSVEKIRTYPLYGRKVVRNGGHVSDGRFIYIEVFMENETDIGTNFRSEYLVYCPTLSATNIITHKFVRKQSLRFPQILGRYGSSQYPNTLILHGNTLLSLSTPNAIIQFTDLNKIKSSNTDYDGILNLALVDYHNILHEICIRYRVDNCDQQITYQKPIQQAVIFNQTNPFTEQFTHQLNSSLITGPVMQYQLNFSQQCKMFVKEGGYQDVLTKLQCLLNMNVRKFGNILDFISLSLSLQRSVDLIITNKYLLCVENKTIQTIIQFSTKKQACQISHQQLNQLFIVCDEGQKSVIKFLRIQNSCDSLKSQKDLTNIQRPNWLTYQYFGMKYSDPYLVFEIPVRFDYNKIYYMSKFNDTDNTIDDEFAQIVKNNSQHFIAKDYDILYDYLYLLLENGIAVYDLSNQKEGRFGHKFGQGNYNDENITTYQPFLWIDAKNLSNALLVDEELVYLQPLFYLQTNYNDIKVQLGTLRQAFKIAIEFQAQPNPILEFQSYNITPLINYKQYKDCYNHIKSRSKNWKDLIIKVCTLQLDDKRIFSNFIPITDRGTKNYIQFYNTDFTTGAMQVVYPFRMENIYTNDTFEIQGDTGELIVSSLFNFLCYYRLATQIQWTFVPIVDQQQDSSLQQHNGISNYRKQQYPVSYHKQTCIVSVNLTNDYFRTSYTFSIIKQVKEDYWKYWVFRGFFILILIISILRVLIQRRKHHEIFKSSSKYLSSHQFQIRVKLNSKKSIGYCEKSEDDGSEGSFVEIKRMHQE